jgi:Mg2+/Co2+ transporter CorB
MMDYNLISADWCAGVTLTPPSVGALIALALAIVLLYASGFVSASEIAFFSLSPQDKSEIEEDSHPADRRIRALLADSETLLATVLISNNFVNVTIIMLCNYFSPARCSGATMWCCSS